MSMQVVVSDSLNRRVPLFAPERFRAFQLAVANVVKGRAKGRHVHTSIHSKRMMYELKQGGYSLFYSVDPYEPGSMVFEDFLSDEEGDLIMNIFAEGPD
jgi:hypothetical protein